MNYGYPSLLTSLPSMDSSNSDMDLFGSDDSGSEEDTVKVKVEKGPWELQTDQEVNNTNMIIAVYEVTNGDICVGGSGDYNVQVYDRNMQHVITLDH